MARHPLGDLLQEPLRLPDEIDVAEPGADERELLHPVHQRGQSLPEHFGLVEERLIDEVPEAHEQAERQQADDRHRVAPPGEVQATLHPGDRPVKRRRDQGGDQHDQDESPKDDEQPEAGHHGEHDGGDAGSDFIGISHVRTITRAAVNEPGRSA